MAKPTGVEKACEMCTLVLCGESLLIEALQASLQDHEGVKITVLDTSRPDAIQELDQLNPAIIVFDLAPSHLSCIFTFLRTHTDVVLIGLDINRDLALSFSGEWRLLPTVADLIQVIEARIQVKNGRSL